MCFLVTQTLGVNPESGVPMMTGCGGFAVWGDNKAKPSICLLLRVHTEVLGEFSLLSQGNIKGEKDNVLVLLFLAEVL